jgi:hypothetical protein
MNKTTMKKIVAIVCAMMVIVSINTVWAGQKEPAARILKSEASHKLTKTERTVLENRVKEIRDMKFDKLTGSEKQELRTELIAIQEKLSAEPFTGIYLSAGAIIIILLVLLIIT